MYSFIAFSFPSSEIEEILFDTDLTRAEAESETETPKRLTLPEAESRMEQLLNEISTAITETILKCLIIRIKNLLRRIAKILSQFPKPSINFLIQTDTTTEPKAGSVTSK